MDDGDLDGDGMVGLSDLGIFQRSFGASLPVPPPPPFPAPAAIVVTHASDGDSRQDSPRPALEVSRRIQVNELRGTPQRVIEETPASRQQSKTALRQTECCNPRRRSSSS